MVEADKVYETASDCGQYKDGESCKLLPSWLEVGKCKTKKLGPVRVVPDRGAMHGCLMEDPMVQRSSDEELAKKLAKFTKLLEEAANTMPSTKVWALMLT